MNNPYQTSPNRELSQQGITLDPRPIAQKMGDWLKQPRNYAKFQIGAAAASVALSFLWLPITVVMLLVQLWYSWQRFQLPMRMPKHLGGIDPTLEAAEPNKDGTGEVIKRKEADGILHLGNQRSVDPAEHLKELWVTNSDARTHMLLMGTTGSGKTVTLLSICFNALAWGSGFFYSDGKADSSLHAAVWSMCRRTGREDDYLVLNFMTGGAEVFKKVAGQAITVETGSYEGSVGNLFPTNFNQALTGSIQRRDRIELQELKALKEMEGILIFKDQVTRARSFTWFHSFKKTKLPFRLNRFLQVDRPQFVELKGKVTPIKATDRRFTIIANIIQKIREGTAKRYPANEDPVLAAVRETWLRIEESNPNEGAVNRGIAYYQAAVSAMRARQPDAQGRYWTTAGGDEEHIPEASRMDRYEGVDFAAESPAIVPSVAGRETPDRTDPYHNPPLQEKAAPNAFAELVREFAESTQRPASVLSSIKEETVSAVVPDDYDALPEAQAAGAVNSGSEDIGGPASSDKTDGGLHEWLAQYQDSQQRDGGTIDDRSMGREQNLIPAQVDLVNPEPPSRTAHQVETNPVVIGFKQEAAEMLVRMEEALGSEDPQQAVQATEREISAQLKWTQPAEDMTIDDIEHLFGSMQANIEKSASKAR